MRPFILIIIVQLFCIESSVADDAIGRLFFTSDQREDLNRLRTTSQQRVIATAPSMQTVERQIKSTDEIKMQGYVERNNDNQRTVWMNGEVLQKGSIQHEFE
jgi:hypothetical protein